MKNISDNEVLDGILEAIEYLKGISAAEYLRSTLPSEIDSAIEDYCLHFMDMSPSAQELFTSSLDAGSCYILTHFAERMAMFAVRNRSTDALLKGLVAILMLNPNVDIDHSDVMVLALLYRSAEVIDDPVTLFRRASTYVMSPTTQASFLAFLDRDEASRSIESMGYREINGPHGVIYQFDSEDIPASLM